MASTFVVACPDCGKQIRVTEEVIGKKIRCKECQGIFPVKEPKTTAAPASKPAPVKPAKKPVPPPQSKPMKKGGPQLDDDEDGKKPYAVAESDEGIVRCPHCVQPMESADDKICIHCGFNIETRKRLEVVAVHQSTGGEIFMWLLPGILCVIGIIALASLSIWAMGQTKGWMREGWFHDTKDGKDVWTLEPGCFMLLNGVVAGFLCYHMGRFAFRRLVRENKPPEREIEKEDDFDADDA